MAFLVRSNLHPPRTTTKPILHHHHHNNLTILTLRKLDTPPVRVTQLNQTLPPPAKDNKNEEQNDFYVNLGLAVRTLREDLPQIFTTKDLNYNIYREDITFLDPLNKFTGISNYKLIFWALRFNGNILFRHISLEVLRIWQPSEKLILIRWNLRGIPRVPWDAASGYFQGTSRYKLDRFGKIYEHKVDNLAFNFPKQLKPLPVVTALDLVAANPTFSVMNLNFHYSSSSSASWLQLYSAVKETLDHHQQPHHSQSSSIPQNCLAPCS